MPYRFAVRMRSIQSFTPTSYYHYSAHVIRHSAYVRLTLCVVLLQEFDSTSPRLSVRWRASHSRSSRRTDDLRNIFYLSIRYPHTCPKCARKTHKVRSTSYRLAEKVPVDQGGYVASVVTVSHSEPGWASSRQFRTIKKEIFVSHG